MEGCVSWDVSLVIYYQIIWEREIKEDEKREPDWESEREELFNYENICFMRNKSSNILSNNLRKRDKGRFRENRDKDRESEREEFSSHEKIYFMGSKSRDILSIYLRKCDKERQKERNRVRKWKRGI